MNEEMVSVNVFLYLQNFYCQLTHWVVNHLSKCYARAGLVHAKYLLLSEFCDSESTKYQQNPLTFAEICSLVAWFATLLAKVFPSYDQAPQELMA